MYIIGGKEVPGPSCAYIRVKVYADSNNFSCKVRARERLSYISLREVARHRPSRAAELQHPRTKVMGGRGTGSNECVHV